MSIWDVPLDKLRASRLLALRMHVARYVVRTGAAQRTAVAFLDEPTIDSYGGMMSELLEACGARNAQILPMPSVAGVLPAADVYLYGEAGTSAAELAVSLREIGVLSMRVLAATQVWVIDLDRFATAPGPHVVDNVEALIRIVIPEAFGANGTPPDEEVALRIV